MKLYSIPLVALSLSLHATSAQAQSAQTQELDRVYSEHLDEGHPDVRYEEWLDQLLAEDSRVRIDPESDSENSSSTRRGGTRWNFGLGNRLGQPLLPKLIIIWVAVIPPGIWGIRYYTENSCYVYDWYPKCDVGLTDLLPLLGPPMVGGMIAEGIIKLIWKDDDGDGDGDDDGDDDTRNPQFYVAPYLHEDASGLTFSSRF
jgi:hypothetical protein